MATVAFRSTPRSSDAAAAAGGGADDAGSTSRAGGGGVHRRSRSLSRYSGRFPPPPPEPDEFSTPRGRFVNKTRGSGFPEISLDDLADEFFRARAESEEDETGPPVAAGRTGRRRGGSAASYRMETESSGRRGRSVASYQMGTESSRQRGRSVSRPPARTAAEGRGAVDSSSLRRRRSMSVARYRCSESENEMDLSHNFITQTKSRSFGNGNFQQPSSRKPTNTGHLLRRSMSQKNFFQSNDCNSSNSSLTDDETRDVRSSKSGTEKTIQAVYAQKKMEHPVGDGEGMELYEAMRKEVRHAVEEIRTELEKVMVKADPTALVNGNCNQAKGSNVVQVITDIRRNYSSKLEQSEKRKQELLAELAVEEQRGQELTKIVKELLPSPKQPSAPERPSRSRRRNNDMTRISRCLTEEAERYFEGFLSNVEDTDLSSFDEERSDTSSTIGGITKLRDSAVHKRIPETNLTNAAPSSAEADGIVLPWLQWETSNDVSPSPFKTKSDVPPASGNSSFAATQEASASYDIDNHITSSRGSWSPQGNEDLSVVSRDDRRSSFGEVRSHLNNTSVGGTKGSSFDMDEYLDLLYSEDLLFETLRQRQRIDSGSLILCGRTLI